MRILMLNWKDIRHPSMGGAEVLTHSVAERWVTAGHEVTIFAARFPGAADEEMINGVRVVRGGNRLTVYWHAARHAHKHAGQYERIIDQINTLPFWTPFYIPQSKRMMLIHQLAREVWFYELPRPLAWIGFVLEPWFLRPYRNERTVTVSDSTKQDLLSLGFRAEKVLVIPEGIDNAPLECLAPKAGPVAFLFAGRLTPMKRVDHIVEAFRIVQRVRPEARLHVLGSGDPEYVARLKHLAQDLSGVVFHGRVPIDQKRSLMQDAHVIVGASVREGWGLFVSEGAALGTPSAVYGVAGLRDSTRHGVTGLVASQCTPQDLADQMLRLANDPVLYERLRTAAWEWARTLTWDRAAVVFSTYLEDQAWTD